MSLETTPGNLGRPPAMPSVVHGSVAGRFDAIADIFAERIASEDDTGDETYAVLQRRSAKVAGALANLGLTAGGRCAFLAPRGRDSLALILAVLRLGAVYVPLDPSYPRAQIDFIVADCQPELIIAEAHALTLIGGLSAPTIDLANLISQASDCTPAASAAISSDDAAYIMYTSGSTGRPKGVIVPHRAILRLVTDQTFARLTSEVRFLHLAPLAFDASTLEIWGPLLNGGSVAIIPETSPALATIGEAIARFRVTSAWFTVGLFNALADYRIEAFAPLSEVLTGGDVLSPSHVSKVMAAHPSLQVINGYGPTENTTFTCCYRIPRDWSGLTRGEALPIGYPIAHTKTLIVDEALIPVDDGEIGELVTGGAGLALGYLNRPELTAEKFIASPFAQGQMLYRTGDLVRRRPDGAIDFVGRVDRQVKISGKRVELDEIEHVVRATPGVADAVVTTFELVGVKRITAFIIPDVDNSEAAFNELDQSPFSNRILLHLKTALPEHMLPSEIRVLAVFPLTPNGKVDRRSLLQVLDSETAQLPTPVASTRFLLDGELVDRLAAAFETISGQGRLERQKRFFDLGLRSLDLMKVHALIQRDVEPSVTLIDLFNYPSIESLSAHLESSTSAGTGAEISRVKEQAVRRKAALALARTKARPTPQPNLRGAR